MLFVCPNDVQRMRSRSFQKDLEEKQLSSIVRLSPSLPTIAKALAEMLIHLQWKTVAIIRTGKYFFFTFSLFYRCYRVEKSVEKSSGQKCREKRSNVSIVYVCTYIRYKYLSTIHHTRTNMDG